MTTRSKRRKIIFGSRNTTDNIEGRINLINDLSFDELLALKKLFMNSQFWIDIIDQRIAKRVAERIRK